MMLPTVDDIRALHEKYAPTREAFELVYTHCEIVWHVAEQLLASDAHPLDADLVRAGALLHDIGVYRLYDNTGRLRTDEYIRHGVLGHAILREEGFPERLCRFCSCHTGVGLTRHDVERQKLPLPPADYVAETGEEQLVMYADKFHTKTTPPAFLSFDTYVTHVSRFGPEKITTFRALRTRFGEPDVALLSARYGHAHT
ncbi:HD domain-containing protein [Streptomyces botrytidirepellens]|uniref:HD domain-containing protein n=2 Tax=Streptomyces botrytidirepellens TaxID=2486417 RepID=A0A3M8TIF8_9ACTN|nr:HD domain-containing protein [Streptomyces botrytidirepellens]RNF93267.1 HD domain-containing protein [Streptomyces botrytidirepellens]